MMVRISWFIQFLNIIGPLPHSTIAQACRGRSEDLANQTDANANGSGALADDSGNTVSGNTIAGSLRQQLQVHRQGRLHRQAGVTATTMLQTTMHGIHDCAVPLPLQQ